MKQDHVLKKLNFDLLTPETGGMERRVCGKIFTTVIPFKMICNMTKLNFDLFTSRVGGGGGGGVCGQNICFHVLAFVIPFDVICKITMF